MEWRAFILELIDFLPRVEGPLVVELVEYLRNKHEIFMAIDWEVWDFVGSGSDDDSPQVAVKSVRNIIPSDVFDSITRSTIPIKVVLVEGANPDIDRLSLQSTILSSVGCGVYIRNYGWLTLPSRKITIQNEESALIKSKKWRKDDDSVWRKRCRRCGERKTTSEYYPSGKKWGVDPYRPQCKACENAARAERRRAKA